MIDVDTLNFEKLNGLIPAIVLDNATHTVLMLGFMNKESLKNTLETKLVTFFSRTRQSLWVKGETSGNFLHLVDIKSDCDDDSLLVYANPDGPTCHTGDFSCFKDSVPADISFLSELFELVQRRKAEMPEKSYTTKAKIESSRKSAKKQLKP